MLRVVSFSLTFTTLCVFMVCSISITTGRGESSVAVSAQACTDEIRKNNCSLPACRCSGEDIPGNFPASQVPQLVFLTFDDAINNNFYFYQDILHNRKNPNGHPITMTFFVSHQYTNYYMVHDLWRHGHEIALHSITHKYNTDYWKTLNESMWQHEVLDQRLQMAAFGNIPIADILGMRAPFLVSGGDTMYSALSAPCGLSWESSRPTPSLLWPYTNDYSSTQSCDISDILACPKGAYPGFWTVPMIQIYGDNGYPCAMADSCLPVPETENATFTLLQNNFLRHYKGNRAPFGVFTHSAWIQPLGETEPEIKERYRGYLRFLDYLATLKDTYIVSVSRALEWIKNPTSLDKLEEFRPFKVNIKPSKCSASLKCTYKIGQYEQRELHSCVSNCPRTYPWLGNPLGE